MTKANAFIVLALVAGGCSKGPDNGPQSSGEWTPPIGIPEPPFGIHEVAGVRTHYVDASAKNCIIAEGAPAGTDFNSEEVPLCRLPLDVPAGSVIEIHGEFRLHHASPANLKLHGTREQPIFIRSANGATGDDRARIKGGAWDINGSYAIIENLIFEDDDGDLTSGTYGMLGIFQPSDHIAVRHNDVSGNLFGGGLQAVADATNATTIKVEYIVFYDNIVHNTGNWEAIEDGTPGADVGGIAIGNVDHAWAVDNTCYRNGVECVWGGAGYLDDARVGHARSHHTFIGRNKTWESRQGGFWQKGGEHIVFSQNSVHSPIDRRAGEGARGQGLGFQYGSEDVWFLFNEMYDVTVGISAAGGTNNSGVNMYAIGNVIHDTVANNGGGGYAMNLYGIENRWIVGNTVYNTYAGISLLNGHNYLANNLVSTITSEGETPQVRHIFFNNETGLGAITLDNNLLHQPGGAAQYNENYVDHSIANLNTLAYAHDNVEGDPKFTDAGARDFSLRDGSAAQDAGSAKLIDELAAKYQQTFGVEIRKDFLGNARPGGGAWDIGAFER